MRSFPGLIPLVGLVAAALASSAARADTIVLRNGRTLSGKIVASGQEAVILEVPAGAGHGTIKIPRSEIASVREGSLEAGESPVGLAPPTPPSRALESRATVDLEARLRELGPSREDLVARLEPTALEAEELARLERGLDSGTAAAAERLAARGRPALLVAARALASPSRTRRAAAARAVELLAKDERTHPYLVALDLPRALIDAAGDEADPGSPGARLAARRALAAIAKRAPGDDSLARGQRLEDPERLALGLLRDGWEAERQELAAAEEPRIRERTEIEAELRRRGLVAPDDRGGHVDTRAADAALAAGTPEAVLLLPRLVVKAPEALAVSGEAGARTLSFKVEVENQGAGPLEIRVSDTGRLDPCAVQKVLARAPGSDRCVTERERSLSRLVPDARHGHRHLDGVLRFELLDETFAPAPGARGGECPACLRDVRRTGPGGPTEARFTGADDLQGISAGWTAVLGPDPARQSVALGAIADGVYWLVVAVPLGFDGASGPDDLLAGARLRLDADGVALLEGLDGKSLRARRAARDRERELH